MSSKEGWRECKIRDLFASSIPGDWGDEGSPDNGVPVLRSTNFRNDGSIDFSDLAFRKIDAPRLEKRRVKKGTILVEKSGGSPVQPAGRVVFCDCDFSGTASNFIEVIEVEDGHSAKYVSYLLYYLYQIGLILKYQQQTTGIINFKLGQYIEEAISLPVDKPEQTKIAEVLSTVDRAIEQTEALIAKQQRIKTGLMQDLLTRGIDEHGNLRSEETHAFKASPLGRIPVEWDIKPLAKLADIDRGKFTHRPRNDPRFYGGTFPFIQTGDVTSRVGRRIYLFSQTLNERGMKVSKEFPVDTIAVTIAANIADTALLAFPMYFPDSVVGAVVRTPNNVRFVELMIRKWKPLLEQLAPQSAQKNINLDTLRPLPIPTAQPAEQDRIGDLYEQAETGQEQSERLLGKLRSTKQALMQDLLTGKKRVTPLLAASEV